MAQYDVRAMYKAFTQGLADLSRTQRDSVQAFMNLLGKNYAPNAMDVKTKELISVGIAVYNRCEYCIVYHTHEALKNGASRAEVEEAAMVSVAFGGGPSMAYSVTLLKECLDEFTKDFQ